MPDKRLVRYGISLTYRCNLRCDRCNRFLNVMPWKDSDLSEGDLKRAGELVHQRGYQPGRIRFTGGEPLLHPQFDRMVDAVWETWKPLRCLVSFTNGVLPRPRYRLRYSWGKSKNKGHDVMRPWMISPADLGMSPHGGFRVGSTCWAQRGCGRLFDAFGFAPCVFAGSLGRVLRMDPYYAEPVLWNDREMCKHCLCTLNRARQLRLQDAVMRGEIEHPTKTYRAGVERFLEEPFTFQKFGER